MRINNPQTFDHIKAVSGEAMRVKNIDIGDWNMDTTTSVSLLHGLTIVNIKNFITYIIRDDSTIIYPLTHSAFFTEFNGSTHLAGASIFLNRRLNGIFDNVNYDAVGFNRGWITIWYES